MQPIECSFLTFLLRFNQHYTDYTVRPSLCLIPLSLPLVAVHPHAGLLELVNCRRPQHPYSAETRSAFNINQAGVHYTQREK
jgi:hypothetical protein